VAGLVAALLIVLAGGAATYGYVRYRFAQVKKVKVPGLARPAPRSVGGKSPPITILLVGSNTRTGLDPSEAKFFGTSQDVGGARSDVTMLLRLNPATGAATLLSIPRDLFVPLPPHSVAGPVGKIDAALNDGPEHLVEAITNDLGIPIDHYVELNFDGFQHVINALGGIDMYFPTPLRDKVSGLSITKAGCQHLGGSRRSRS
jgi:LCP family protein required for cell wall assembly